MKRLGDGRAVFIRSTLALAEIYARLVDSVAAVHPFHPFVTSHLVAA